MQRKSFHRCQKYSKKYGYSFFFYSKEHEPIHIHVEGEEGVAIYDLVDDDFVLRDTKGKVKASSLKKIYNTTTEEKERIISAWNKYFGTSGN